ncbi:alpha/beta hydrolase [Actinoallomurus bryophytorum]|uniref:Pimeloyl-ACP methyl ester carboxylesterase n=1 Tax=Actinoallomurus bryophytorum TaxID=1490222 RepID=A0A543CGK9_9ACTN|nr:alpha/beta hydrolase [Actinoallomurus bryophytorum]TQL96208.1 pimeloyl-ACP methyl ester carboxylesterase [Actinoallomurus bryophytorum]
MPVVTSADGTVIAYERTGSGPALVLVDGALCHRGGGPMRPLAALLRDGFTVYAYDRRGRGESSDTTPYAVDREIEDLQALIEEAGGTAYVYGISSGAALALAAAAAGPSITKVALYEPPFMAEVEDGARITDYSERLSELLDARRDGDAVELFMTNVGVPAPAVAGIRAQPGWAALEAVAPTLAYDDQVLGDGGVPRDLAAAVTVPALVLAGTGSPQGLQQAAKATADALPTAGHLTLEGQTHDVSPEALAPALAAFFAA